LSKLGGLLRRMIEEQGPIDVGRFMALALAHPEHGYYSGRDPLGAEGDFVTAPEISQLFGELLGLALVQFWLDSGRPRPALLVELGPGRGSLLADALRAARVVPAFIDAVELHLVELSPILRARQAETLTGHRPHWHPSLQGVPGTGPLLLLANEFFDALPIRQFLRHRGRWHERLVASEGDRLQFALSPMPAPLALPEEEAREGRVLEVSPAREAFAQELGRRLTEQGGVALIVDYGEDGAPPHDTLQAVRAHRAVDPLEAPGETDLTAHVDFAALARAARYGGAATYGPIAQGLLLRRLGIELRLEQLTAGASADVAASLEAGVRRLIDADAMGELFRALAVTAPGAPIPPGFVTEESSA
jgi:NADH dehydrogenase [ubiquinone] 1 alpha subcomplex assembly factor 7